MEFNSEWKKFYYIIIKKLICHIEKPSDMYLTFYKGSIYFLMNLNFVGNENND